ncbi:T9SS type A sorting domain-containing protein [candidate division KSB1 bacterium]|nr:T9SS type A sorting domain-containing protein [candidate division KSB1 bacterium]
MSRRILLAIVPVLLVAGAGLAQAPVSVPFMVKAKTLPTIDANLGDWNLVYWIDLNKTTEPDGGRTEVNFPVTGDVDLSGRMALMWDENNLYFAAVINDTIPGAAGSAWFGDGLEIYLSSVPLAADALHGPEHGTTFYDETDGKYEVHLFVRYDAQADTSALIVFMPAALGQVKGADVEIDGALNADEDGYFLEGRIGWNAIKSPTTGNTFSFQGGERVAATWSLIDIDTPLSSVGYGALQFPVDPTRGPNGNPGGPVWEVMDVRSDAAANAAELDTIFTYLNEPFMKRPDDAVVIDADLSEWNLVFWVDLNKTTEPDGGRTEVNFPVTGDVDLSGQMALMWDEDNLYFAAVINDTLPGAAGSAWFGDGLEIYLSNVPLAPGALNGPDHGTTFYDEADGKYEVHLFVRYDAQADTSALIVFMPAALGQVKGADVEIVGALNADEDGYFLEGRIGWNAIKSPTTGNTFNFQGGERVPAQFSLIDIDTPLSSVGYGAIQLLKNRGFGPNGNPGGQVWNTIDVLGVSFVENNLRTGVAEKGRSEVARGFDLAQNYPNPFNPATAVKFTLDKPGIVSLKIYNISGQLVKTVIDNIAMNGGPHTVGVDLSGVTSGTYFYALQQGNRIIAKKMMLVK